MKIVSAAEMREIDRATSEQFGVPSLSLMENAGAAVARFVLNEYPEAERVSVVCGKGNNGGDGFVVARKLREAGKAVRCLLLCKPDEVLGDAAAMLKRLAERPVVAANEAELNSQAVEEVFSADIIVDAVLGTGFRPPVSRLYASAIKKMNASPAVMVAVDIPSGANADSMTSDAGEVARADEVVTFTAPRPAHVFANLTSGSTVIAPIGSPPQAIVSKLALNLSSPQDFGNLLAPRQRDANKGSYGHVLVIGGSLGKAGAAAMAGYSALRAGAGLSTVATARSVLPTVAGFHSELMTEALEETNVGTIARVNIDSGSLQSLIERKSVLAIGPGISRHPETADLVRALVKEARTTMVLDADALNAFEDRASELNGHNRQIVVTPHPGEMARLTGLSIAAIQQDRLGVARDFARRHELIVVLKGHRTLVASPSGEVWVNPTGNPGMATGGTGDVLTGIVAGLIAQHPQHIFRATVLAVYLHGLAGDIASKGLGETSLVATDLVRFLPIAFLKSQNERTGEVRI
jgi:NAD(P)H-hydrate epimerase